MDAGFSCREMEARLAALGVDPGALDLILLSHEHGDHARGAERFSGRFGCTLAGTAATLRCLGLSRVSPRPLTLESGRARRVGSWVVTGIKVPHDAADPVAFRLDTPEGSIGYALDLGHAPEPVIRKLQGCQVQIVESNHDSDLLEQGPYPRELKQRLKGPRGHLSNGEAAEFIAGIATRETRNLVLAHLSCTNNRADLAMLSAHRALGHLSGSIRMTVDDQELRDSWIEV